MHPTTDIWPEKGQCAQLMRTVEFVISKVSEWFCWRSLEMGVAYIHEVEVYAQNYDDLGVVIIIIIMVATYIAHRSAKLALMALYIIYEHREKYRNHKIRQNKYRVSMYYYVILNKCVLSDDLNDTVEDI